MKNKIFKLLSLVIVISLIIGCQSPGDKKGEVKNIEENTTPVRAMMPEKGDISSSIHFNGEVKAFGEYYLMAKISERIVKINVKNGQRVHKGDILFLLDQSSFQETLNQAEAALDTARSKFETAQKDLERNKVLYNKKVINEKSFDNAKDMTEAAENGLRQTEASYRLAKENFDNTMIKAPVDGFFVDSSGDIGQVVNPGFMFGRVLAPEKIIVEAWVSRKQVQKIKEGQACISEKVRGEVLSVNTSADRNTRNYLVKMVFENKDNIFSVNSFISGEIMTSTFYNVPLITEDAVLYDKDGYFLFVAENGKAIKKRIEVKARNNNFYYSDQITSDDMIIYSGQAVLSGGEKVKVLTDKQGEI
ncbi:MAG: hypothetical protein C0601_10290 [Candidatus Muiribacterium halophilum]|uniref:Multidrug resistance protein MdtA-like barrel-sandwich hybrid domain-containing protein n=1 Tax=Muiribacterium halophilum TaxID=2053465 RepID=A0A2N5ZCH2_MUIH1|nr:MAG: hypothetical protein C0601_10290 [Candidatus Muirbacterium halophilum]